MFFSAFYRQSRFRGDCNPRNKAIGVPVCVTSVIVIPCELPENPHNIRNRRITHLSCLYNGRAVARKTVTMLDL